MDDLHSNLHSATMTWFESLYPHMADRPGEVGDYWHEAPLWPDTIATETIPTCPDCELGFEGEQYEIGDVCVECGESQLVPGNIPKKNEEGQPIYEWVVGLKSLEEWFRKTEQSTRTEGTFRPQTKTVEMPHRLKPEHLFRIARYLDKAAEQMGILADTDEALPLGEI